MTRRQSDVSQDQSGITPNAQIAEIRAALKAEPDNAELWLQLGMEYSQSLFEESIRDYSVAIGLSPFNGEYYFHRGRKYLSTDQYAEALADFHASLCWIVDGQSWHYLGVALYYLEQYAEAARYFGKALEMNEKERRRLRLARGGLDVDVPDARGRRRRRAGA